MSLFNETFLVSKTTQTPPVTPAAGESYFVPLGATDAWVGLEGKIVTWGPLPPGFPSGDGAWNQSDPNSDLIYVVIDENSTQWIWSTRLGGRWMPTGFDSEATRTWYLGPNIDGPKSDDPALNGGQNPNYPLETMANVPAGTLGTQHQVIVIGGGPIDGEFQIPDYVTVVAPGVTFTGKIILGEHSRIFFGEHNPANPAEKMLGQAKFPIVACWYTCDSVVCIGTSLGLDADKTGANVFLDIGILHASSSNPAITSLAGQYRGVIDKVLVNADNVTAIDLSGGGTTSHSLVIREIEKGSPIFTNSRLLHVDGQVVDLHILDRLSWVGQIAVLDTGTLYYNVSGGESSVDHNGGTLEAWYGANFNTLRVGGRDVNTFNETGIISGGEITNGTGPAQFTVAAGTGMIVDNTTDPTSPTLVEVSWGEFVDEALPNIATEVATELYIDSGGNLVKAIPASGVAVASGIPQPDKLRDLISLGVVYHFDNATVTGILHRRINTPDFALAAADFYTAVLGVVNMSGNEYSANGANLLIDKSAGEVFSPGINYVANKKIPNIATTPAQSPVPQFVEAYEDGLGGWVSSLSTQITPDRYDTGGGGGWAPIPNPNDAGLQFIFYVADANITIVVPSKVVYSKIEDARAGYPSVPVPDISSLADGAVFRGWLIVEKSTTDLSNTAEATFIVATSSVATGGGSSIAPVNSVFGRTGNVVATLGDYKQLDITFEDGAYSGSASDLFLIGRKPTGTGAPVFVGIPFPTILAASPYVTFNGGADPIATINVTGFYRLTFEMNTLFFVGDSANDSALLTKIGIAVNGITALDASVDPSAIADTSYAYDACIGEGVNLGEASAGRTGLILSLSAGDTIQVVAAVANDHSTTPLPDVYAIDRQFVIQRLS